MNENTKKLKGLFLANHIEVFGIAPASFLEKESVGSRPADLLREANSSIC
jgi:hypothetical protein